MKNMIKKNQIVIFTVALMLIVAGYMNYTANSEKALQTAGIMDAEKYADLGDATLVSSEALVENENTEGEKGTEEEAASSISSEETTNENEKETEEIVQTAANNEDNSEYFTQSRLDRDTMYSQMIESYQKLLANPDISEAQKNIAQEEIKKINDKKNSIMIAENLIKNKGLKNVVIFINDNSVNVILDEKDLKQEQIAQIQNIVQREIHSEIEDIHISSK